MLANKRCMRSIGGFPENHEGGANVPPSLDAAGLRLHDSVREVVVIRGSGVFLYVGVRLDFVAPRIDVSRTLAPRPCDVVRCVGIIERSSAGHVIAVERRQYGPWGRRGSVDLDPLIHFVEARPRTRTRHRHSVNGRDHPRGKGNAGVTG